MDRREPSFGPSEPPVRPEPAVASSRSVELEDSGTRLFGRDSLATPRRSIGQASTGRIIWAVIGCAIAVWIVSNAAGDRYVTECKELMGRDPAFGQFRRSFEYVGNGRTYQAGAPQTTTGYYTKFKMTYGQSDPYSLTCYSSMAGSFTNAELNSDWSGRYCMSLDGRKTFGSCP
jgi:hypothetical protein